MFIDTAKGDFLTPVLRLVQGDCFASQDKNMDGKPLIDDNGKPYVQFFIGCAGRKGDPAVEAFKAQIEAQSRKDWPHLFQGHGGACTHPSFSYKIVDGDGFDNSGKPNNVKEGFAGHWIFRFTTGFAPRCFAAGKYNPMDQLSVVGGVNPIPRGYNIRVHGTMKTNGNEKKPGTRLFHDLIEFSSVGQVIISGPDAGSVFGGGGAAPAPAPAPAAPAPAAPAPAAPAPAAPAPAAPAPAAPAPTPATFSAFTMLPAAGAFTREQYHASGHTDESLIAQGYMVRNAPVAAAAPAPAPVAVAPHPGILTPAAPAPLAPAGSAPPPAPPVPTAVAAPGFKMTNPVGPSYASYIAANWTDAALIQNGHMVPA